MATVESFITSSADHQDAVFRLVQYSAKLLGSMHYGRRGEALANLASSIDSSRIMMRTFGIFYALRAVLTGSSEAPLLARLSDLSLLLYHPCETSYWMLTVSGWESARSWDVSRRRTFSRLSSLFGCMWSLLASLASSRRLRQLRAARLALEKRQEERVQQGWQQERQQQHSGARDEAGSSVAMRGGALQLAEDDATDLTALTADAAMERLRLIKLLLDAALNFNWAVDHPKRGLSSFGIGLLGASSAWLGLRVAFDAHKVAIEEAEAEDAKWDAEEYDEPTTEIEEGE